MASSGTLNLRLVYEGKKYLLEKLPNTRQELLTMALDKLRLPIGKDYLLQYLETETERIVITDDSDLTVVKSLALSENRRVIQVSIDRLDDRASFGKRNSLSTALPLVSSNSQSFDPATYHEFLKNKIPEISEEFEAAMLKGVPCEECLGMKRYRGKKCENCYGKGYRPMTPATQLMIRLIDYKIREYVMAPLKAYCSKSKEEEAEGSSPPLEKATANGGPSPKGVPVNNIVIEQVPSCDVSILENKKNTGGGLRPVPRRGGDRMSEGMGKFRSNPLGMAGMQHPPRKSSSREDLADLPGRTTIQMYSKIDSRNRPSIVPEGDRQNTWADKKMAKNQDSVNYNSLHKSVLSSQEQSHVSVKLFNSQAKPSGDHYSMVVAGANDTSTRELNKTTPGNLTFSRHEVKFELSTKLDPIQVDVSKGDTICKLSVVNKSQFFWRSGMVFALCVELEGKNIEDYALVKEVQPEETVALFFDLRKYIKPDTKACKGSLSVRKGVDEVQKLHLFSEKYSINIEFV